ncbi:fungal-specific transcription factor domain-containing protein [Xylariales sp. AK1849]|nr:fungal-specific transcription factor domain-containing protein [Xylariales sp. AK1849]
MAAASPNDAWSPVEMSADHSPDENGGDSFNTPTNERRDTATSAGASGVSHSASGATVIDPSVEPSSTLNPRSCVTCRRRKVRCDKQMPCGNCRKARISCIFPAPGRAPRRPRPRDPNAPPKQTSEREVELVKRLRKLEGIVEELSGQIEVEARHPSGLAESPEATTDDAERRRQDSTTSSTTSSTTANQFIPGGFPLPTAPGRLINASTTSWGTVPSPTIGAKKDVGRLVLNNNGKTRYVSNAFWSKMNDELDQLRADTRMLTDEESDDSGDGGSSPATVLSFKELSADHHSFVLGYRSSDVDLRKLHPLPSQIPFIWQVYTENVDPLVKILHIPTMNNIIRKIRSDMTSMSPGLEALMFSIYYAAITSLEEDEVKTNFGAEKSHLIKQYRFGTEQALAKANFLNTSELIVVQAFAIFLVLVRRYDDTRFSWTLSGLLIRIAQSLGIHREGTHFANLSPFDIEMRRRLWWAICILDLRSAEDQGTELTIGERTFDTQFPLNINDTDLTSDMKEFPPERSGATDLTFCLVRYEICTLARKMHAATNLMSPCPRDTQLSLQEREDMLLELSQRLEDKYLKPCTDEEGDLLHWVAATISRLIMAKMSLIIYQPILFPSAHESRDVSQEVRDRLFMSSTEVVEYNRLLNVEPKCKQYRWLFQTYTQWHAVAYLLLEVCRRPWSSSTERAWVALHDVFQETEPSEYTRLAQNAAVWMPLKKLMMKGKRHREAEIARLQADPQAAKQLDIESNRKTPPASFHQLPSSVRNTLAQERWRKLVGIPTPETKGHGGCFENPAATPRAATDPKSHPQPQPQPQPQDQDQERLVQSNFDYISNVITQPNFNPTDFWQFAFSPDTGDLARQAVFGNGGPSGVMPQQPQQPPLLSMSSNGSPITSKGGIAFPRDTSTTPAMQTLTNMPPSTVLAQGTGMADDNPPPWAWPDAVKWNDPAATTNGAAIPTIDEGDVNMDEDFDWQDWQQSIRGFELDAGLGLGINGSGTGFSGGV